MIHYTHTPLPCVFSKNPVNFEIFASNFSVESNVFPFIKLEFVNKIRWGYFFEFHFINPDTLEEVVANFMGYSSPNKDGKSIPGASNANTPVDNAYVAEVAEFMQSNEVLSSFYDIEVYNLEILIIAKQGVKELIPTDFFTNNSFSPNPESIITTISTAYWKARKRAGHRINVNIYFEKEYLSNEFELVSSQSDTVDADGFQNIDINSILDSEIKNSFSTPPLPEATDPNAANIIQKANVLRRYYIESTEQWSNMQQPIKWVKSDVFHVHFGGVSMDDFSRDNPFNYIRSERMALTWWRDKKRIYPEQNDWMSVMNVENYGRTFDVELEILYKDGATTSHALGSQDVRSWETITIPVGFNQLNIAARQDSSKEVYGWKIKTQSTDPSPSAGGVIIYRIYLLHHPQNFKTNTIVYLNSFGVAESFVCSGFFENSLNTSIDIASRTLKHDYKSINGRDFVFNKSSKNAFKARTGVLNKQEAKALQSMLNVAPVFLLENELLRPIIIEADKFTIDDERDITQTLDLKIIKSLELTNVSEMITKPTLTVVENCGQFTVYVNSEKKVDVYGDLTTRKGGVPFEVTSFAGDNYAVATKAEDDDIYSFTCDVTIAGELFNLSSTYSFKREIAKLQSALKRPSAGILSFEITSSEIEKLRINNQSDYHLEVTTDVGVPEIISTTANKGSYETIISASCLSNIDYFLINSETFSYFEFDKMINLRYLNIINCNLSEHFSTSNFKNLRWINLMSNSIDSFELGMNLDIQFLSLENNNLPKLSIEMLIKELYDYRKLFTKKYDPQVTVNLIGNPGNISISPDAVAMKNGTGIYAGDGLLQNDIIIYL